MSPDNLSEVLTLLKNDKEPSYKSRAEAVREIAQGIYDETERQKVLELVDDFEKMAAGQSGKTASRPSLTTM